MPSTEVVEVVQPIMLQPVWVTVAIQLLTLIIAGGISYGMTRAKLSSNEKEIVALQAKMAEIEKDFNLWQRQRLSSVVTLEDCGRVQHACKESICKKIDSLDNKMEHYIRGAETNWRTIALTIGRLCEKLEIQSPSFK